MRVVPDGNQFVIACDCLSWSETKGPLYWTEWHWDGVEHSKRYPTLEAAETAIEAELARQPCVIRFMLPNGCY